MHPSMLKNAMEENMEKSWSWIFAKVATERSFVITSLEDLITDNKTLQDLWSNLKIDYEGETIATIFSSSQSIPLKTPKKAKRTTTSSTIVPCTMGAAGVVSLKDSLMALASTSTSTQETENTSAIWSAMSFSTEEESGKLLRSFVNNIVGSHFLSLSITPCKRLREAGAISEKGWVNTWKAKEVVGASFDLLVNENEEIMSLLVPLMTKLKEKLVQHGAKLKPKS